MQDRLIFVVVHDDLTPCGGQQLMRFGKCAQVPNVRVGNLSPSPGHPARV